MSEVPATPLARLILLEEALGIAVLTGAPPASRIVTTAMSVNPLPPGDAGERGAGGPRPRAQLRIGLTVTEAVVEDALGRTAAHATGSLLTVWRWGPRSGSYASGGAAAPAPHPASACFATVLITDIVGSTRRAQQLGDERWRELLAQHDAVVRRQLQTFNGREVKSTGDGFLAAFESPAQAVQCARSIRDRLHTLEIEIRVGIHTGECERVGNDLTGIAVHTASRIQSVASPGEILDISGQRAAVRGRRLGHPWR